MRIPTFKVSCAVCGGLGVGDGDAFAGQWNADIDVVHTDPRICQRNLLETYAKYFVSKLAEAQQKAEEENVQT